VKKITNNLGVAALVTGACVWLGVVAFSSWDKLIHTHAANGEPIEDRPFAFDETTPEGRELIEISRNPGWQDDPVLAKRFQEIFERKYPERELTPPQSTPAPQERGR
jgi:hypothetical protein